MICLEKAQSPNFQSVSNSVPDGGDAGHCEAGALGRQPEHAGDADELRGHVAGEEEGEGGDAAAGAAGKEYGPRVEGGGEVLSDVFPEEEEEGEWQAMLEMG